MANSALVRFYYPDLGARMGLRLGDQVHDLSSYFPSLGAWLRTTNGRVAQAIEELENFARQSSQRFPVDTFTTSPTRDQPHWLAPIEEQDVWASGVTYERSREARQEEAVDGGDIYARVYRAERPELFFKAHGKQVIGPYGEVGIRADATWSVPEAELALVINPAMEVVGLSIGNDMSSRDIEGENPLYLPQAKIYTASCSLGPEIVLGATLTWPSTTIRISIQRGGVVIFEGDIHTSRIQRHINQLITYLGRSNQFPDGVVLLTGTGIVPPSDFTLAAGDIVEISIEGIGKLVNPVKVV